MQLIIKEANTDDLRGVLQTFNLGAKARSELKKYEENYFQNGKRSPFFAGYPEQVLVVKKGDSLVGYLHFFTDCFDGDENTIISSGTRPNLEDDWDKIAQRILREEMDSQP